MWDLIYYAVLKLVLGWPATLGTWEVLFLLPLPWIGPVWAPMLIAAALVGAGSYLYVTAERARRVRALDWTIEIAAGVLVVVSFTLDWRVVVDGRMPGRFPSEIFWAGFLAGLAWFVHRERQERGVAAPKVELEAAARERTA